MKKPNICVDMHMHLGISRDGAALSGCGIQKLLVQYPISHAVLFPIDERDPGPSFSNANTRIAALVRKNRRLIGFARFNPRQTQAAYGELQRAVKLGLRGIKLHPRSENFCPADTEDFFDAVEKERLPVVLHTSHEHNCHPASWEAIFLRHKKIPFILAHAGKDAYQEAGAVALRCPNVYLDTSTLSYHRTAVLLKKVGPRKIVFASDAPYSHPALELLKFDLLLGQNISAQRKIFCDNPKRILGGLP